MKYKSKKGSSLISLLVIMGVLVIISISVLSLTVGDYKLRIHESNRIKNLYKAESGLEETYGILGNIVDNAVLEGNEAVANKLDSLGDYDLKDKDISDIQNSEFKAAYKNKVVEDIKKLIQDNSGFLLIKSEEIGPKVLCENTIGDIKFNNEDKLILNLKSTFITDGPQANAIERTIASRFIIDSPEYNNPFSVETVKVNLPIRNIWSKALYADKNLKVLGEANIHGDIYARGDDAGDSEYKGIIIDGTSSKLQLSGEAITAQDTILKGNNSSLIIYSTDPSLFPNLYTGSLSIEPMVQGGIIDINGSVFAKNDLVLNGTKSKITVRKGYYGFNDVKELKDDDDEAKNSSAIIINSSDIGQGSFITIVEEAMLMGTAYIRTEEIYQTGESVAVKGNYRAYTRTFSPEETGEDDFMYSEHNVQLEYIKPLQLVTKFRNGSALVVDDKSRYFMLYSQITGNEGNMKLKGITLPENTISAGSIISNDRVKVGNYIPSEDAKIKKDKYKAKVDSIEVFSKEINPSVSSSLKIEKVFDNYKEVIYADHQGKDLVLTNDYSSHIPGEKIIIQNNNGQGIGKGIIITSGSVTIEENVDFTGTIIAGGNIIISGKNVKLSYDSNYIKVKIAENMTYFKNLFTGKSFDSKEIELVTNIESEDISSSIRNSCITSDSWRIVK